MKICLLYPDLLGTYGDGGNVLTLRERSVRRGLDVEVLSVAHGEEVPSADLYVLGGGEDGPQRLATELLRASTFSRRVEDGAKVFAVCAGLQILGNTFSVEGDDEFEGLALVDCVTTRGPVRSVGDFGTLIEAKRLVGFENHGGLTTLASNVAPLGSVVRGRGNDGVVDGYRTPSVWATYAHGPVLAQNPWFCDEILTWVLGVELSPLASIADDLYDQRCRQVFA